MGKPIIPLAIETSPLLERSSLAMPVELADELMVTNAPAVVLGFGRRRMLLHLHVGDVSPLATAPGTIHLSPMAAQALRIPTPLRLLARIQVKASTPVIDLGPLVGLLFRDRALQYHPWAIAAQLHHTEMFLFRIGDVHWRRRVVYGYRAIPGGWRPWVYPLPHVVYDRSPGGWVFEGKSAFFRRLAHLGVKTFNRAVGYKWDIHRRLWAMPHIRPYLPETVALGRKTPLIRLLSRWEGAFLKPSEGQRGQGIVRVKELSANRYAVHLSPRSKPLSVDRAALVRFVRRLMAQGPYVAQREIELVRVDDRVWDVRTLVFRDQHGKWRLGGVAARLGQKGRIVSNLHQGGHPAPVLPLLQQLFGEDKARQLMDGIARASVEVAAGVQRFAPYAGDLGIDLGIDQRGDIWLIEVNPKPGRQSFLSLGAPEDAVEIYGQPLQFARFLAGFSTPAGNA